MAFDEETIKGILENAETAAEDKLKLILSEHEADVRGLTGNRDELKGEKEKIEARLKSAEKKLEEHVAKVTGLEEELKKNDPEARQKYFENQLTSIRNEYETKIRESEEKRSFYERSHFDHLREKAIEEALRDIPVDERYRSGFISLVLSRNKFEPVDVNNDGKIKFLSNNKELKDIFHAVSVTDEGRNYLRATSSGGGAPGSGSVRPKTANPWAKDTFNLTDQGRIFKENPALATQLKSEAGIA
ncbi:MAG: hypothetical protein LBP69_02805 [Treponema sp.]|jgi:Skp family chaperone for outer membrane proteins|nr:hypothetical protein [Treponema sp.]